MVRLWLQARLVRTAPREISVADTHVVAGRAGKATKGRACDDVGIKRVRDNGARRSAGKCPFAIGVETSCQTRHKRQAKEDLGDLHVAPPPKGFVVIQDLTEKAGVWHGVFTPALGAVATTRRWRSAQKDDLTHKGPGLREGEG